MRALLSVCAGLALVTVGLFPAASANADVIDIAWGFVPGSTVVVTVFCNRATADLSLIRPGFDNTARYTAFAVIDPFRATEDSSLLIGKSP